MLRQQFFDRSALTVARGLLGNFLVRRAGRKTIAAMITEVEAYDGPRDKASHASRGRTKRNAPMFGPAGHWYIYFTYGMHWMLNIVTGLTGYPAAVLIRSCDRATKYEQNTKLRKRPITTARGIRIIGPARVTKFFGIAKSVAKRINGELANRKTGLWIEDRGVRVDPRRIRRLARVGVGYAGRVWAGKRYRFILKMTND